MVIIGKGESDCTFMEYVHTSQLDERIKNYLIDAINISKDTDVTSN